jgi:hypothetical protein
VSCESQYIDSQHWRISTKSGGLDPNLPYLRL